MSDQMAYAVMKHDIITICETATMRQAADLMKTKQIRHLPVTNSVGRIVGVLTRIFHTVCVIWYFNKPHFFIKICGLKSEFWQVLDKVPPTPIMTMVMILF